MEKKVEVSAVEFRPYADDPHEIAACNMYQEPIGYLIYKSWGARHEETFSFFFRRQIAPCTLCAREVIDCSCEQYDV